MRKLPLASSCSKCLSDFSSEETKAWKGHLAKWQSWLLNTRAAYVTIWAVHVTIALCDGPGGGIANLDVQYNLWRYMQNCVHAFCGGVSKVFIWFSKQPLTPTRVRGPVPDVWNWTRPSKETRRLCYLKCSPGLVSPGSLWENANLWPHSRHTESEAGF